MTGGVPHPGGRLSQLLLIGGLTALLAHAETPAPGANPLRAQLVLWNASAVAVAVGDIAGVPAAVLTGSVALLAGLRLLARELRPLDPGSRRSIARRRHGYSRLLGFLAGSVVAGVALADRARAIVGTMVVTHRLWGVWEATVQC